LCLFLLTNAKAETDRASDSAWAKTLQRVANSVVAIRVDAARAFDTAGSSSTEATGFVVDAERGIILTNRHVVQSGPVIAEALFLNREEVELKPIYRDPVHDFGFFQYDPAKLKFIKPQALKLTPQKAKVGREIRVVGNDAGEQLSILAGTLARLDRQAPEYGFARYNDFNTFYYQSASGVSGGSSGSPVVDIEGDVLALNAGGSRGASSSFFLPLEQVVRALALIKQNKPVTRGTLQTTLDYLPYDEVRRLGLRPEIEAQLRKVNHGVGVLVVERVLPGGPADGILLPGDIVLKGGVNNTRDWLRKFDEFAELLDNNVGNTIVMQVERNGRPLDVKLNVGDLHAITPDRYLSFGGAVLHDLSYQQARHLNRPLQGVYVAQPGYVFSTAGLPVGAVIVELDNQPVTNIDEFEKILEHLGDGDQVIVRYFTFSETFRMHVSIMRMDRRWFAAEKCRRNDIQGVWDCVELGRGAMPRFQPASEVNIARYKDKRADKLSASLVHVQFDIPYNIDGVQQPHYGGAGLIIDAENGLVLVDRNTVPVTIGDVRLVFGGALDIPGKVLFVHPLHNIAIVQYDPRLLGDSRIKSATLKPRELASGDEVWLVGMKGDFSLLSEKISIASLEPLEFGLPQVPTFRESNLDVITLNNAPLTQGGVLADEDGNIVAQWASFGFNDGKEFRQFEWGIPIDLVQELLEQWRCCKTFRVYSLEAELATLTIAQARKLDLPDSWVNKFQSSDDKRQVLAVARRVAGSDAATKLQEGDLVLAVDDKPVRTFREVEKLSQKPQVTLTILRAGKEQKIPLNTTELGGRDTTHIVQWAGALIQTPHRALAEQRGLAGNGVYVSFVWYGSPADRYRLQAVTRIVEMNGQPVRDLNEFIQLARATRDSEFIQLRVLDLLNKESVITLKQNNRYWPAREIYLDGSEWRSRDL